MKNTIKKLKTALVLFLLVSITLLICSINIIVENKGIYSKAENVLLATCLVGFSVFTICSYIIYKDLKFYKNHNE